MIYSTTIQQQKKQETIEFYDHYDHLERFGFTWKNNQPEFEYSVKLSVDKKKVIKKISLGKSTRRKICVDESRILGVNLRSNETNSMLFEYIEGNFIESVLGITTNDTKDLKNVTVQQKNKTLKQYDLTRGSAQECYASKPEIYTVLRPNNQK